MDDDVKAQMTAGDALSQWIEKYLHNSVISQDTEKYNLIMRQLCDVLLILTSEGL